MNRFNRAPLPLLALLVGLSALAQEAQQQPQQFRQGSPQDNVLAVNELNRQTAFLAADQNRVNEIYKRAAAVVRSRYLQIARPAISLGRLLKVPVCGGTSGRGVLVPGPVNGQGLVSLDPSTYPNFQNCAFVFETYAHDEGAPLDVENQTALFADIRVNLVFDQVMGQQQPPSNFRAPSQPVVHWGIDLISEPYVYQGLPNIPPPISLAKTPPTQKPNWPGNAELDGLEDHRDFGVDNRGTQAPLNRMAIAKRAIEGHEGGIVQLSSVVEDPRIAPGLDPCGETRLPKMGFIGVPASGVIEDHCYTYSARVVAWGDQRADPKYRGQVRIRFQKDLRTGKIIGIRAFSFGGDI